MLERTDNATAIVDAGDILLSAKAKYKDGDYEGAIVEYTLAIQFHPQIALAVCCRGDAYYKLGKKEQALADYNRAIDLDPQLTIGYYRRGNLYSSMKNYALAVGEYSQAIELKPNFALAYSNRGFAYRELYGEGEATIDWQLAAKLFEEQGNSEQCQYMLDLIALNTSIDTLSGMLG
jgi:tetratricopeptide (TPR) repeat protein